MGGVDLIDFQWDGIVTASTAGETFEVPVEFRSIPSVAPQCAQSLVVNSVYYSTSTSVLNEQSSSSSYGFSQTTTLKAGIEADGVTAEASTDITNALMFGRSSASSSAREHSATSYSWSFSLQTVVKFYEAQIEWNGHSVELQFKDSFLEDIDALNDDASARAVMKLIKNWGSHVMAEAQTGATCKETAYSSSKSSRSEVSDFQKHVSSTTVDFLFFHFDSEASTETQTSGTWENDVDYEFADIYCKGEVDYTSSCGGLTGAANNPVVVSHALLSIFDIDTVAQRLSNETMARVDSFFERLYQSLNNCSATFCSSNGTCSLSGQIWSDSFIESWDDTDFPLLWDTNEDTDSYYCFCNDDRFGNDCSLTENCLLYGADDGCCYDDNTCDSGYLCDPLTTQCLASDEPSVQCGTYGAFIECSSGVITSACGSGGGSDCAEYSGKCPSEAGFNGIYCDYTALGGYTSTGDWTCASYGVSQSCLDDASGGDLMVGVCGSGSGEDCSLNCKGYAGILCASISEVSIDASSCVWLAQPDWGQFLSCPDDYVATGYCGSGSGKDCDDNVIKLECCRLSY